MLRKKILFATDYDVLSELQDSFLHRSGFNLLIAENGPRVLDMVDEDRPDLIILPCDLAQLSGADCCRRLKADPFLRTIPVVLVVNSPQKEYDCTADRILDRFSLPFQLLDAVCALLQITQRAKSRYRVAFESSLSGPDDFAAVGRARNISIGGLFVETGELLQVNRILDVRFQLPERSAPLQCRARVAWVNHPEWLKKGDLPTGLGLEFVEMAAEDRSFLNEYMATQCSEPFY